jgi:dipeptidyl aminopeptidase/acylaminoacyl peptidase
MTTALDRRAVRLLYQALKKAGVPAELHTYAAGGHGISWTHSS